MPRIEKIRSDISVFFVLEKEYLSRPIRLLITTSAGLFLCSHSFADGGIKGCQHKLNQEWGAIKGRKILLLRINFLLAENCIFEERFFCYKLQVVSRKPLVKQLDIVSSYSILLGRKQELMITEEQIKELSKKHQIDSFSIIKEYLSGLGRE